MTQKITQEMMDQNVIKTMADIMDVASQELMRKDLVDDLSISYHKGSEVIEIHNADDENPFMKAIRVASSFDAKHFTVTSEYDLDETGGHEILRVIGIDEGRVFSAVSAVHRNDWGMVIRVDAPVLTEMSESGEGMSIPSKTIGEAVLAVHENSAAIH